MSLLSEKDCRFQGAAARALLRIRTKDEVEPHVPSKARDHRRRPQRNFRHGLNNDTIKDGCSVDVLHWTVRVDRSSALSLGMHLDVESCRVHSVRWNGLIGSWNVENPGKELRAGDKIVAVNGCCKLNEMIAECLKLQELRIEVERMKTIDIRERRQWSVHIDRSSNASLGVVVDATTKEVLSVSWNGLVGEWNMDHLDKCVKAGDRIVKVNGYSAADRIIAECQTKQPLHIVVESARKPKSANSNRRWSIEVSRDSADLLGITLDRTTLQITSVAWNGLVGAWNVSCDDSARIVKRGDRIVEVNSQTDAISIVSECQKSLSLRLVLERQNN